MNFLSKTFILSLGLLSANAGRFENREHHKKQWKDFVSVAFGEKESTFVFPPKRTKINVNVKNILGAMAIFITYPEKIHQWTNDYENYIDFRDTNFSIVPDRLQDQRNFLQFLNTTNTFSNYNKALDFLSPEDFQSLCIVRKKLTDIVEQGHQGTHEISNHHFKQIINCHFDENYEEHIEEKFFNKYFQTKKYCEELLLKKDVINQYIQKYPLDQEVQEFCIVSDILNLINSTENIEKKIKKLSKKINFFYKILCTTFSYKIFSKNFIKKKPVAYLRPILKKIPETSDEMYKFVTPFHENYNELVEEIERKILTDEFILNLKINKKSMLCNREMIYYDFDEDYLILKSKNKNHEQIIEDLMTFICTKEVIYHEEVEEYNKKIDLFYDNHRQNEYIDFPDNLQNEYIDFSDTLKYLHINNYLNLYIFENNFHHYIFDSLHEGLKFSILAKDFSKQGNFYVRKVFSAQMVFNVAPYIFGNHVANFYMKPEINSHGGEVEHYLKENMKLVNFFYENRDVFLNPLSKFNRYSQINILNKLSCCLHIIKMDKLIHQRLFSKLCPKNYEILIEGFNAYYLDIQHQFQISPLKKIIKFRKNKY